MSTHRKIEWSLFILGIVGSVFSGYLSAVKFFTETCAFTETCPLFLGYPACYVGFGLFMTIMVAAGLHVFHVIDGMRANEVVYGVSILGVLFSGYYTILELPLLFQDGLRAYVLGLPTCALGFICFCAVCILSHRLRTDFI